MDGRSRFVAACRGEPVDATPVWFMRQAGGLLPGYLERRRTQSVLEISRSATMAAEVSVEAATTLGTDAAVLFADVMLPMEALGLALELTPRGPILERPVRSASDLARLRTVDVEADLGFVLESVRLVRRAVGNAAAVVGVAGGPFTLAAYAIEGGPSRDKLAARALMHAEPALWAALLDAITDVSVRYVGAQVEAGADAVQVFDSWAGVLPPDDYDRCVAPWTGRILAAIEAHGAAAIHFVAAGAALLERVAAGASVVGVDTAQSLTDARRRLGDTPVQGNLDPARIAAGWRSTSTGIDRVLAANAGRAGHIFNTGHAVPRETAPMMLRDVVRAVHDRSAGAGRDAAAMPAGASA
jgi:uroporphyrinogen decarboxylase